MSTELGAADALVIFGVTGDLAMRKIFPALLAMTAKGTLKVPVVGVARGLDSRDALIARIREHMKPEEAQGATFTEFLKRLSFVPGDYETPTTYSALADALTKAGAKHPAYYLAVPPSMFGPVVRGLGKPSEGARVIVEKPFGRDVASAAALQEQLTAVFPEAAIFRIDHYLGKESVQNLVYAHLANELLDAALHRHCVSHVQITMAETLGMEGRGRFYDEVGTIRDVLQNHLLQVMACLGMECPTDATTAARRAETARFLAAIAPLREEDIVRGQYRGYAEEPDIKAGSTTETYVAARFSVRTERWSGVPFLVRAGKKMPVTVTEVLVRFQQPLWARVRCEGTPASGNSLRFQLSPGVVVAAGLRVKRAGFGLVGEELELVATHEPADEMLPYERLFADALMGERELFASYDAVSAQWNAVEPILATPESSGPKPFVYAPGTWGPAEADRLLPPGARWHEPKPAPHAPTPARADTPNPSGGANGRDAEERRDASHPLHA